MFAEYIPAVLAAGLYLLVALGALSIHCNLAACKDTVHDGHPGDW